MSRTVKKRWTLLGVAGGSWGDARGRRQPRRRRRHRGGGKRGGTAEHVAADDHGYRAGGSEARRPQGPVEWQPDGLQRLLGALRPGRGQLREHQRRQRPKRLRAQEASTSATRSGSRCRRRTRTAAPSRPRCRPPSSLPRRSRRRRFRTAAPRRAERCPVASVSPPARLTIDQTQISPSTITYGTRSLTARFHVTACSGSVEGALVYVTAVPYGQFANAERAGHRLRRLGDPAVHGARRLPGQQQATAAGDVRPCPQDRREPARRHLHPPARLLPRHPRVS